MDTNLSAEGGTQTISTQCYTMAASLGVLRDNVEDTRNQLTGWSIEGLDTARDRTEEAIQALLVIGEVVGIGGAVLRETLRQNSMVGAEETVTGKAR